MRHFFIAALLAFSTTALGQTLSLIPTDGTTDTIQGCSGTIADGGGLNGNYTTYNNGYLIIDPTSPNAQVQLTFSTFAMYHTSDYIQIWDGVGTSSTFLGYYSGTALPNAGNAITSTNGALTVQFYSNYYGNAAGFVGSWTTTDTVAPTANFSYTTTSQNYNTPVQFVNTTTNGGEYYWDFGDGTTSTQEHPSHAYTDPGSKTVTLIATNCFSSDTITNTLTISAAPSVLPYTSPITMTVPCGTTGTEYWTLENDAGAGIFTASFDIYDTSGVEHITFENGLEGASLIIGTGTVSRVNSTVQGTKALQLSNANSSATLSIPVQGSGSGFQPTYFSYRTKASSAGWRAGKFQMASSNTTSPSILGYTFWSGTTNYFGIRRKTVSGSLGFDYAIKTTGSWVLVEYKNIDWAAETFDLYLDGTFFNTYSFLNPTSQPGSDHVSYLRMVNDYNTDVAQIDDIQIGNGPANSSLTVSPASTTILAGNASTMSLSYDASNKTAGTYYSFLVVSSNDTLIDGDSISVEINVTGDYSFTPDSDTLQLGNIPTGQWHQDSLLIVNTGCKKMEVDSLTFTYSGLMAQLSSANPYDSNYLYVDFAPAVAGPITTPISVHVGDSTYTVYLSADAYDAPSIHMDSTSFTMHYTGCPDSILLPLWIYNDGQDTLSWNVNNVGTQITDDFESSTMKSSLWSSYGPGAYNGVTCGVITGSNNLTFYGSGTREAITKPLNLTSGGTISFDLNQGTCNAAETSEGVWVSYSTDGGLNWTNIQYFHTYATGFVATTTIPAGAMTSATKIRIQQTYFTSGTLDNWIIDNFVIDAGMAQEFTYSTSSGTIAAGDSTLVYAIIGTDSLNEGTYTFSGFVASNDPVDSITVIDLTLHLDGVSETFVHQLGCLNLDTLVKGQAFYDTLLVENLGCDSLLLGTLSSTNSGFNLSALDGDIYVSDTTRVAFSFTPTTTGTIADTIFIATSDTTWPICVTGVVENAPLAWANDSTISLVTQNCGDSVAFSFDIGNSVSNTNMTWSVNANKALNVVLIAKNSYPVLVTNIHNFLNQQNNIALRVENSLSGAVDALDWADLVIFAPLNGNTSSSSYTALQNDFQDYVEDGGKMLIFGSPYVNNVLSMSFIGAHYQGNYTGYNMFISNWNSNGYLDNVPTTSFVAPSTTFAARFYTSPHNYHVYYSTTSQTFTRAERGDGEVLYIGHSFLSPSPQFEKIFENVLTKTLSEKPEEANWVSFTNPTGSTSGGDTATINGIAYSDSLNVGTYTKTIQVSTNDPANPTLFIPIEFTVNGKGEMTIENTCNDFGDIFQGANVTKDVPVYNTGCDTLEIVGSFTGGTSFISAQTDTIVIAPSDTGLVAVSIYHLTVATITDSLTLYTATDSIVACLEADIIGAAAVSVTPDSLEVTINKCNGFQSIPYTIENNGDATLTYSISTGEIYDSTASGEWLYPAPNYSNLQTHTFNGIIDSDTLFYTIILNGEYSSTNNYFYLYVNNSYTTTLYDNNITDYTNDTITGFLTGWRLQNAITAGYLELDIYSYNYNSVAGQTMSVQVYQKGPTPWASPVGITSGSLASNNTVSRSVLLTVTSLAVGTYQTNVIITSNDPDDPTYLLPITLHVVNQPKLDVVGSNLNYGQVFNTNMVSDSVLLENNGCTDLVISNVVSNNAHFVPAWTAKTITAGSSEWLKVDFTATTNGIQTGVLTITSNDSTEFVAAQAEVIFAPVADFQFAVQNNCTGLTTFINESQNGAQYFWSFDDGLFSGDISPTHTFERPGTYTVMLVTLNAGGADTTYKTVTVNDVLYLAYEAPDTAQAGQVVQFIDSSLVPNSWQWFFGDGNTSTTPSPQHTYANKGTYFVTLSASNAAGCSGTENKSIVITSGIGIDESKDLTLQVSPNPSTGIINIASSLTYDQILIYNSLGQMISTIPYTDRLDLSELPAGAYTLHLLGTEMKSTVPIQIVH